MPDVIDADAVIAPDATPVLDADSPPSTVPIASTGGPVAASNTIEKTDYDIDRARESARRFIAYALLAILAAVIVLIVFFPLAFLLTVNEANKNQLEPVIQLINIVFGPIVTLVGSATGFYFGAQSAKSTG